MTTTETSTRIPVRVLAADPFLRVGLESALGECPEFTFDRDGTGVQVLAADEIDDAVLCAIRAARERKSTVLLVVGKVDASTAVRAIEAGACGVLRREQACAQTLISAVRAASTGHGTMSPDLLSGLFETAGRLSSTPAAPSLDARERDVLRMVADGHETAEIASALAYSTRTVTSIVHDITHRLRLRNRAHAVAFALRQGLI
ncbi:response regulator transcription factor [Amycolatopsis sp. H20-H5]|uniref:response regulator transcription factor n=1 Tax=Amycolatopsis sp. H20-H5 TaxID=3046309 RepID=UPI002DBCE61F|nr:response regulator transcription factor [Amycolatopsis sp. H20-H5]MEC3979518.1 response regulator transcription factor [Amycolatopsis sp. H20-H5]